MSAMDVDLSKIIIRIDWVCCKLTDMHEWSLSKELEKAKLELELYCEIQRQQKV